VTSVSLLVDGPDTAAAVRLAKQRPDLSLGVHVAFDDRGRWFINVQDPRAVRRELDRQLEAFVRLTGAPPTHIDSHHHAHRFFNVARHFLEAGARHGVPVRGFSEVYFAEEGIRLISFREYGRLASRSRHHLVAGGCAPTASGR
jgi:predicted glycoside hydrolase/deacetylase ChbG (UPF0249 family)